MGSPAPQTSGSFLPSRFPSRSSSRCAVLVSQHSRDACCNTRMQTLQKKPATLACTYRLTHDTYSMQSSKLSRPLLFF